MSGFIYIWLDRKHKRYYVGSHWGSPDDGYVCSSSWMKQAYKHRPHDFKRRIIAKITTSRKDLLIEEQRWLGMIKPHEIKVRYYNLMTRADHLWHADPDKSKTIGEKISAAKTGRPVKFKDPAERALRISEGKKRAFEKRRAETGQAMTDEHIAKMAAAKMGRSHTEEWKAANSKRMREQWGEGGSRRVSR